MKKCTECKYRISIDNGYSNWTVEGTDIHCLKGLNPDFPADEFYGENQKLDFAESCITFTKGDGVEVDVDMEEGDLIDYSNDPEIKQLLKEFNYD